MAKKSTFGRISIAAASIALLSNTTFAVAQEQPGTGGAVQPGTTTEAPPDDEQAPDEEQGSETDGSESPDSEDKEEGQPAEDSAQPGTGGAVQPGTITDNPPVQPEEVQPAPEPAPLPETPVYETPVVEETPPAPVVEAVAPVYETPIAEQVPPAPVSQPEPAPIVEDAAPEPLVEVSLSGAGDGSVAVTEDATGTSTIGDWDTEWTSGAVDVHVSHPDKSGNVTATDHLSGQSMSWNVSLAMQADQWIQDQPWADELERSVLVASDDFPSSVETSAAGVDVSAKFAQ